MSEIDSFFKAPPDMGPGPGNTRSILFLLRRDLRDLSCPETQPLSTQPSLKAPVLASAGIFIGLEILGRIWVGKNDPGQAELVKAISEILSVTVEKADLILHFRNSLMHGYQLEIHARDENIYRFRLHSNISSTHFFEKTIINGETEYEVSFWELRKRFLEAIHKAHAEVSADSEKLTNFNAVLPYLKSYKMNNQ